MTLDLFLFFSVCIRFLMTKNATTKTLRKVTITPAIMPSFASAERPLPEDRGLADFVALAAEVAVELEIRGVAPVHVKNPGHPPFM
jgi:hypothetical protein